MLYTETCISIYINQGALAGTLLGFSTSIWLAVGSTLYPHKDPQQLPYASTENCVLANSSNYSYGFNTTYTFQESAHIDTLMQSNGTERLVDTYLIF